MLEDFIKKLKLRYSWLWIWNKQERRKYRKDFYNFTHYGTRVIYNIEDSNEIIKDLLSRGGGILV